MQPLTSIISIASVSALGDSIKEVWESYCAGQPLFSKEKWDDATEWESHISSEIEKQLSDLKKENSSYKNLDRSVLLAMLASRKLSDSSKEPLEQVGVNIGSSRGATQLFEKYHEQFQKKGKVSPFSSPTTTLGNISSWVGQDLGVQGMQIEHSVTCSTALHAVLNGIAWLQADMATAFIVGGSEAALTPFTLAQMQALKLYSHSESDFPCESMKFDKRMNTMILGEGAAVALIEKGVSKDALALISGYGVAAEKIEHGSSISENAICFQHSMQQALDNANIVTVDAVVMHAPGTVQGDKAEKNAIDIVFDKQLPLLTSNKWMVGHTFGASGMLSLEMAVLMLQHEQFIENPFYSYSEKELQKPLKYILVNAVGFGGNAVSIIISKSRT